MLVVVMVFGGSGDARGVGDTSVVVLVQVVVLM